MLKISIITVTYNSEKYLEECIKSTFNQDYRNIEYIIIDGSSKDNTLKIIEKNKEKITKTISEPDQGIYDAINKGINLATGEVIGVIHSDDIFTNDFVISKIAKSFIEDEELEAVYADVNFINRENTNKIIRHYSSEFFKPWMFKFGFQPAHPTFYVKKELFEKHGLYRTDLKIAGDFELLLRFILKHKIKYKYVKDIWVKMRVGGVSSSGISSVTKLNSEIIKAHRDNNLYTNKIFIYSKYLFKWWGFLKKK